MEKLFLTLLFSFIITGILSVNAQGIIDKPKDIDDGFRTRQQQLNYYVQQSMGSEGALEKVMPNSTVFINQIGDDNIAEIATNSTASNIKLNQLGNSNQIDLKLRADVIEYSITQQGNNNLLLEYNNFLGKQYIDRKILQKGNNQNLVIHGRNSIVDKMEITMEIGSQSLIIRNTN